MGDRGAGHRPVGRLAVKPALLPVLLLLPLLGGCQLMGELVGAGAGGASAAATANPAVGIAVGVGVNAGIDATVAWIGRKRQGSEQDAIAEAVATMQPGEQRPWHIHYFLSFGDEHGMVTVVRPVPNALAPCKEVAFSVDAGSGNEQTRQWYVTEACDDGGRWKWAAAEPATERWGALQ